MSTIQPNEDAADVIRRQTILIDRLTSELATANAIILDLQGDNLRLRQRLDAIAKSPMESTRVLPL